MLAAFKPLSSTEGPTRKEPMPKRKAQFHIRKTRKGEYRPYLKAGNGEQVGGSETYKTRQGAIRWIDKMFTWVDQAKLEDIVNE